MTPDEMFTDFENGFSRRKFTAGLLVAFIDFFVSLDTPSKGFKSFADFLQAFPREMRTTAGGSANTLIVRKPDEKTLSIRPFYNAIERYYRAEQKRFDYPSAAPHATQAWVDYGRWLDALVTFAPAELATLRGRINQFVLNALPSQEFDPSSVQIEPPLFQLLLDGFEMAAKSEPTGAAFQGTVFGFLRADNPHLQIEIDKVRTGAKRLQRIGDVDGWEGERLAISAEVKQYVLKANDISGIESFANAIGRRGALGIIAALGFENETRKNLEALGVVPLDRADMLRIVELWDPVKQRIAVSSLVYYATHIEKNSSLRKRIDEFLSDAAAEWLASHGSQTRRSDE